MRHLHFLTLAISAFPALLLNSTVSAQTKIGDAQVMILNGTCETLILGKDQLGSACSPKIMSTSYPDGRVGFYFVLNGGRTITFSGMDGDNPTPDTDIMMIDKVIANLDAPKRGRPEALRATGKCSYGNPYKGRMTVACKGRLAGGGAFEGVFTTDGRPPT